MQVKKGDKNTRLSYQRDVYFYHQVILKTSNEVLITFKSNMKSLLINQIAVLFLPSVL